jgi:Na+-translocating ferredoxin:NAD+ oxidoreductase RnfE subunit
MNSYLKIFILLVVSVNIFIVGAIKAYAEDSKTTKSNKIIEFTHNISFECSTMSLASVARILEQKKQGNFSLFANFMEECEPTTARLGDFIYVIASDCSIRIYELKPPLKN